jgi:FtsH-binding integral membrane protein
LGDNNVSGRLWRKRNRKRFGLIVASIGIGLVITVVIPVWGWIITVGGVLIYCGWYLIGHN